MSLQTTISADDVANTHMRSFRVNTSQRNLYLGCKTTNIYSRAVNKVAWSSVVFKKIGGAGNPNTGYSFTIPNDGNSTLAYLLKAVLNITLPKATLSNICPS